MWHIKILYKLENKIVTVNTFEDINVTWYDCPPPCNVSQIKSDVLLEYKVVYFSCRYQIP